MIGSGEICSARAVAKQRLTSEHEDNIQINAKKHTNALLAAIRSRGQKKEVERVC